MRLRRWRQQPQIRFRSGMDYGCRGVCALRCGKTAGHIRKPREGQDHALQVAVQGSRRRIRSRLRQEGRRDRLLPGMRQREDEALPALDEGEPRHQVRRLPGEEVHPGQRPGDYRAYQGRAGRLPRRDGPLRAPARLHDMGARRRFRQRGLAARDGAVPRRV